MGGPGFAPEVKAMSPFLISVRDLTKTYTVGDVAVRALRGVSLDVYGR